jgi:hypothetical protein
MRHKCQPSEIDTPSYVNHIIDIALGSWYNKYRPFLMPSGHFSNYTTQSRPRLHHNFLHTAANMVSFRTIITSVLALAAPIAAQATTAQVVEGLEGLTQKAAALQAPAQSITIVNGPL